MKFINENNAAYSSERSSINGFYPFYISNPRHGEVEDDLSNI